MVVANTVAYGFPATFTAVISFIVQVPVVLQAEQLKGVILNTVCNFLKLRHYNNTYKDLTFNNLT